MSENRFIRGSGEVALDTASGIAGLALVLSPWLFAFTGIAAWNAWIVGAAIALIAIGASVAFANWEEWTNLGLGLWAVVAPWILGFSDIAAAAYAHVLVGLLVAASAGVELWLIHRRPISA